MSLQHIPKIPRVLDPLETSLPNDFLSSRSNESESSHSNVVSSGLDASLAKSVHQIREIGKKRDVAYLSSADADLFKSLDSPVSDLLSESHEMPASIHVSSTASPSANLLATAPSFRVRIIASPIDPENIVFAVRLLSGESFSEVSDWPVNPELGMTRSKIIADFAADAAMCGFVFEVMP